VATRTGPIFDSQLIEGQPDRVYQLPSSVPPMMAGALGGSSGVTRGLTVTARTPASLTVDVQPGTVFIDGFFFEVYGTAEPVTLTAGGASPRVDRVTVKLDRAARTISLQVVQGTPGQGKPALPADHAQLYFIDVPANASSVTNPRDERVWARAAGIAAGDIKATARPTAPPGWLLCDGRTISRADHADLFDAIGTAFGAGDGSTTFRLPDLRTRFPVGAGSGHPLGSTGGAASVALNASHLPAHSHPAGSLSTASAGSHRHDLAFRTWPSATAHNHSSGATISGATTTAGYSVSTSNAPIEASNTHSHVMSGSTGSTGGSAGHENRPPYVAVNWIIAT
jgi:microcystin-dependent protein